MRWWARMNERLVRVPKSSAGPVPLLSTELPARSSTRLGWVFTSTYSPKGRRMTRSGQRRLAASGPAQGLGSGAADAGATAQAAAATGRQSSRRGRGRGRVGRAGGYAEEGAG